ncbi:MAG: hypothetical protein IGS49_13230 [Chlorogloeopsis fritschii C42_A2020_084]|uniref:DUF6658 family protein n=1 Tax=Chlorogloeopsis fritschii TaxID=1124 RepID=UPI0019ED22F6|nr:DUF6658 family protein [Chlorogloeopsis fritschii]MBF2006390.1 hypothetical protein [Chlorogloeopsis fritschii C42_A2020_084]
MNSLTAFLKKLQIRQILTVFLAGLLLIVSTACSKPYPNAANPNNLPVQAGGANNPYKNGGDKYTNLKMSKSGRDQASLQLNSQQLIAATNSEELLYPGAETPVGRAYKEGELPIKSEKDFQKSEPGGQIQYESNVGERVKDRLETVKEAVQEASGFLKEKADEAGARPELQKNPAVGR